MMEAEILKTVGQVAGIGGLAIGAFIIVFREVIRKNIFPNLVKEQAYKLLRLIIILAWTVAIFGIGTWAYIETSKNNKPPGTTNYQVSGLITDDSGNILPDVDVFVVGGVDRAKTTSSGSFILNVGGYEGSLINLQASKDSYNPWNDNIRIPNTGIRITLKKINLLPVDTNQTQLSNKSSSPSKTVNNKNQPSRASPNKSDIKSGIIQQSSSKPSDGEQNE
ncbi:MAG: hypothetical protein WA584_17590 [Pyrinomonadaceae bacterium]